MEAPKKQKRMAIILISLIVATFGFLIYYFFLKDAVPNNTLVGDGLMVEDEFGEMVDPFAVSPDGTTSSEAGQDLLTLLNDLRSIELDTSLSEGGGLDNFTDFTHTIEPQEVGRENPFAPVEGMLGTETAGESTSQ